MWFNNWRRGWRARSSASSSHAPRPSPFRHGRLRLEQLEVRMLPSNYFAASVSDLIADINAANKAGGSNTITLTSPATSPYVITIVDNTTDGPTGLPVIDKKNTLTIIGNGDTIERSTSSGTPDFRLFDVASGGSLTLQSITLQNGLAFGPGTAAEGGAIYNQGTSVLSAVTLQSNAAQGSNGASGQAGGDASGGAVWSGSSLTMENGTVVQNNLAGGGTGGSSRKFAFGKIGVGGNAFGGGVFVAGGAGTFSRVTIDNNVAVGGLGGSAFNGRDGLIYAAAGNGSGGGVYIAAGIVTMSSDTLDGDQAEGGTNPDGSADGYAYGGGIYLAAGMMTLSNGTMASNLATANASNLASLQAAGGGIYIARNATATLCNDTVESNSASSGFGAFAVNVAVAGGIYIESGATVYIDSFTVAHTINNTDDSNGSTANIDGTYILQNC
jgi:hypothetical protein